MRTLMLVLVLSLSACASVVPSPTPETTVVDGVELFEEDIGCPNAETCEAIALAATDWLDRVAPGHSPVTSINHYPLIERDTNGDPAVVTRTSIILAVVLTLEDGTERATIVECGLSGCNQADPTIHPIIPAE